MAPFRIDDENSVRFENNGDYNQIVDWIKLETTEGVIAPNETHTIKFTIDVPEDTPAGGQYATIVTRTKKDPSVDNSMNIQNVFEISHLIYGDVAGETIRKGNISDVSVSSFLMSGKITGNAMIENIGNVHADASQVMQVFPLFSNEEAFTNEENPKNALIMPGQKRATSLSWDETPSIGIFHVIYKVNFEGVESKVDKMVIVCPLWLLFLIILAIFLLIFRLLSAKKKDKK